MTSPNLTANSSELTAGEGEAEVAVEVLANYSFFRQAPIVPQKEQHLNPEMQYDANLSFVQNFSEKITGWSLCKLDYLIERGIGLDKAPMIRRFIFEPFEPLTAYRGGRFMRSLIYATLILKG